MTWKAVFAHKLWALLSPLLSSEREFRQEFSDTSGCAQEFPEGLPEEVTQGLL